MREKLVSASCSQTLDAGVDVPPGKQTKSCHRLVRLLHGCCRSSFASAMPYSPLLFCQEATVVVHCWQNRHAVFFVFLASLAFLPGPIIVEHRGYGEARTPVMARCVIKTLLSVISMFSFPSWYLSTIYFSISNNQVVPIRSGLFDYQLWNVSLIFVDSSKRTVVILTMCSNTVFLAKKKPARGIKLCRRVSC